MNKRIFESNCEILMQDYELNKVVLDECKNIIYKYDNATTDDLLNLLQDIQYLLSNNLDNYLKVIKFLSDTIKAIDKK